MPDGEDYSEKKKWFSRLSGGLKKSSDKLVSSISSIYPQRGFNEEFWEELEGNLVQADMGIKASLKMIELMKKEVREQKVRTKEDFYLFLKEIIAGQLDQETPALFPTDKKLKIFIIVGVNGVGKTTTIAKIAYQAKKIGLKPLIAAADTFRAAAIEQLEVWAKKVDVDLVKHQRGSDPAAVVYDAVAAAKARKVDILLVDTAGRLHTQINLMEELKKIKRITLREAGEAIVETLLVLDSTTGQNAISQAKLFTESLEVEAIALTKLDGSARGGIIVAIVEEFGIPVQLVGVGEGMEDMQLFQPAEFVTALIP